MRQAVAVFLVHPFALCPLHHPVFYVVSVVVAIVVVEIYWRWWHVDHADLDFILEGQVVQRIINQILIL